MSNLFNFHFMIISVYTCCYKYLTFFSNKLILNYIILYYIYYDKILMQKSSPLNDIYKEKLIETVVNNNTSKKISTRCSINSNNSSKIEIEPQIFLLKVFDPETGNYNSIPVKKLKSENVEVTNLNEES